MNNQKACHESNMKTIKSSGRKFAQERISIAFNLRQSLTSYLKEVPKGNTGFLHSHGHLQNQPLKVAFPLQRAKASKRSKKVEHWHSYDTNIPSLKSV